MTMPIKGTKLTWRRIFALLGITFFLGRIFLEWISPGLFTSKQVFAFASLILIVKFFAEIPSIVERNKELRRSNATLSQHFSALLPTKLVSLCRLEIAQQRGFFCWLSGACPTKNQPSGEVFSYHNKSQYSTIFAMLILSCMVELPSCSLMLEVTIDDFLVRRYIHWILSISVAYTMVWLFSDRHLIRSTFHIIGKDALHLKVGARFNAKIPWNACSNAYAISHTKELQDSRRKWLLKNGLHPGATITCTPFDQPNVALVLHENSQGHIEKYKLVRDNIQYVLIYVDEPQKFVCAIRERMVNLKSSVPAEQNIED
jgi:hypothetical protein